MSFIDDGITRENELRARNRLFHTEAPKIYESLWNQITAYLEEARQKKEFTLTTNGSLYERTVQIQVRRPGAALPHLEEFKLWMELDKEKLIAKGRRGVDLTFQFENAGGIAQLTHHGSAITIDDAAVLILKPFLFPGLEF